MPSSAESRTTTTTKAVPELKYELVLSEGDERSANRIVRYAVKEKRISKKDATSSYEDVTVQRWLKLLTTTTTTTTTTTQQEQRHSSSSSEYYPLIEQFNTILVQTDMKAFFFETKGVSHRTSQTTPFEFVLVESSYLYDFADAQQDPTDFGDKLHCGNPVGCVFPNLGGDSMLIAPTNHDQQNDNVYGHLAAFIRRAPSTRQQVIPFWKLALETFQQTLLEDKDKTYWFSTDGTGVKWLHMRIDPRPKYYDYRPFAVAAPP